MRAFDVEILGPVAVVAGYDGKDDAVAVSPYGPAAGIIGQDIGRAGRQAWVSA